MKLAELKKRVKMVRLKRLAKEIALEGQMTAQTTHWSGCWREHHDCAVAEIERLREALAAISDIECDCGRSYLLGNCGCHGRAVQIADAALAGQPQPAEAPGLVRCPEAGHAPCICNDCEHAREHRHVPGCDDSERHDLAGCPACVPVKEG